MGVVEADIVLIILKCSLFDSMLYMLQYSVYMPQAYVQSYVPLCNFPPCLFLKLIFFNLG